MEHGGAGALANGPIADGAALISPRVTWRAPKLLRHKKERAKAICRLDLQWRGGGPRQDWMDDAMQWLKPMKQANRATFPRNGRLACNPDVGDPGRTASTRRMKRTRRRRRCIALLPMEPATRVSVQVESEWVLKAGHRRWNGWRGAPTGMSSISNA